MTARHWMHGTLVVLAACLSCAGPLGKGGGHARVFRATGIGLTEELPAGEGGIPSGMIVRAGGIGLPAPDAVDEDRKRRTAVEAATAVAMARLVGELEGVTVTREARVRNMVFDGEEIVIKAAGVLTGVRILESQYDAEKGEARVMVATGVGRSIGPPGKDAGPPALSAAARRAQAEQAARLDAMVKLRGQVGGVRLRQEVTVRNLALSSQAARLVVEGVIRGVEFSEPEWSGESRCSVKAVARLTAEQYAELSGMAAGGS